MSHSTWSEKHIRATSKKSFVITKLSVPSSIIVKIVSDWLTKTSEQSFKFQWTFQLIFGFFFFWDHNDLLFWHQINRKKLQLGFENARILGTCHPALVSRWINYFRNQEVFCAIVLSVILFCEYVMFLLALLKNWPQFSKAGSWHGFTVHTPRTESCLSFPAQLGKQKSSAHRVFQHCFCLCSLIFFLYSYSVWSISHFFKYGVQPECCFFDFKHILNWWILKHF